MKTKSHMLAGANLQEPFARTAIGLIAVGMGPSLITHVPPMYSVSIQGPDERVELSPEGQDLALRCDTLWSKWQRDYEFPNGVLEYEFNLEDNNAPKGVLVKVTRFHENLANDRLGMWRFVLAVQFDVDHNGTFSEPDFLVGKDS